MSISSSLRRTFFAVTFSIVVNSRLYGADSFTLSAKELLEKANAASATDKSADVVLLLEDERRIFDDDAKLHTIYHAIFVVQNQQGVDNWSTFQQTWEPWHQKRPIIQVRVVTPDAVVHELEYRASAENMSVWRTTNDLLTLTDASLSGLAFQYTDGDDWSRFNQHFRTRGFHAAARFPGRSAALGLRLDPAAAMAKLKSAGMANIVARSLTAAKDSRPGIAGAQCRNRPFRLEGNGGLNLTDEAVQPPASVAVKDAGLEVENFYFPPPHDTSAPRRGFIHAWINAPGIALT